MPLKFCGFFKCVCEAEVHQLTWIVLSETHQFWKHLDPKVRRGREDVSHHKCWDELNSWEFFHTSHAGICCHYLKLTTQAYPVAGDSSTRGWRRETSLKVYFIFISGQSMMAQILKQLWRTLCHELWFTCQQKVRLKLWLVSVILSSYTKLNMCKLSKRQQLNNQPHPRSREQTVLLAHFEREHVVLQFQQMQFYFFKACFDNNLLVRCSVANHMSLSSNYPIIII